MQILKDESKNNKVGRPEITGATRNRDPLCCACNGVATMLILRYGRGGVIGQLPDFFDVWNDWPSRNSLFSKSDGEGVLPYTGSVSEPGHIQLFSDMKQAAGLLGIMSHTATKLRSFGAMHAHQKHASNPEIERMGRCVSCRYPTTATASPLPHRRYSSTPNPIPSSIPQMECEQHCGWRSRRWPDDEQALLADSLYRGSVGSGWV